MLQHPGDLLTATNAELLLLQLLPETHQLVLFMRLLILICLVDLLIDDLDLGIQLAHDLITKPGDVPVVVDALGDGKEEEHRVQ